MNPFDTTQVSKRSRKARISYDLIAFGLGAIILVLAGKFLLSSTSFSVHNFLDWLFALTSQQVTWYITRAAGIIAYLLLWLSTVWGLVIPSKIFGEVMAGDFIFDFHQFISLLSLGFLGLHIVVLTADKYMPYTLTQLLVPFLSPYRPVWVGIGVIAFYLLLLVTVTFYLRRQISNKSFRIIHYTSLLAYLGAVAHSIFSGTDSSLPVMMVLYIGTFAVVLFLTVYWLVRLWVGRSNKVSQEQVILQDRR